MSMHGDQGLEVPEAMRQRLAEGEALFGQGEIEKAIQAFEEVLEKVPDWADAWNDLGAVHYAFDRRSEAEECFRWALSLDRGSIDALANLARLLLETERPEEAASLLPALERVAPHDPEIRYLRERLNIPQTPWGSLIARCMPTASNALALGRDTVLEDELRRQGMNPAAAKDDPEVLVATTEPSTMALESAREGTRLLRLSEKGEATAPEGNTWIEVAGFASDGDGGWISAERRGSDPLDCRIFQKGSGTRVADEIPLHSLSALVIDWDRRAGRAHRWMRSSLRALGIAVMEAPQELCEAIGKGDAQAGAIELTRQLRPSTVIIEACLSQARELKRSVLSLGVPVIAAGIPSPDATLPGVVPMPWPPQERQMNESMLVALRAVGPGMRRHEDVTATAPRLSVIATSTSSFASCDALLTSLRQQTLPGGCFELVLVSSPDAAQRLEAETTQGGWPFAIRTLAVEGSQTAQRNAGWKTARGATLVFLDLQSRLASDALMRHLMQHEKEASDPESKRFAIVQGSFSFDRQQRSKPLYDLVHRSRLLRPAPAPERSCLGLRNDNCSMPRWALENGGGFSEKLSGILETGHFASRMDGEWQVEIRHDPRIRADRARSLDVAKLMEEGRALGRDLRVLWDESGIWEGLPACGEAPDRGYWLDLRVNLESDAADPEALQRELDGMGAADQPQVAEEAELRKALMKCWKGAIISGLLAGEMEASQRPSKLTDGLTSVIMPNLNGFPHVRNAVESLRQQGMDKVELIVVDNGSNDGSREWLAKQNDLTLISLGENLGAPTARNRGLAQAKGETILFCDNDVVFTPRWRELLIAHMEQWNDIGLVGPMSDYVTGSQRSAERPLPSEKLDDFATRFHTENEGRHGYTLRMISFFVMVRREVIDQIGGFDELFNPWGFEDDDFSLRAAAAGWQLRVARDVFVRHVGSQTSKSAKLDYNQILLDNWEAFKKKWDIAPELPYGSPYDAAGLVARGFDGAKLVSPIETQRAEASV